MVVAKSLCARVWIVDFGKPAMEISETRAPQMQSYSSTAVRGLKPAPNIANEWRLELWIHY
jgi:hypothetical protein